MNEVIVTKKNSDARTEFLNRESKREEQAKERAEKSPYKNFVQLNRNNIIHIIQACSENKQAVRVLLFLITHMDKNNAVICTYTILKDQLGISQPTVSRSIKYLENNGFIEIKKAGRGNRYIINNDLIWRSKASNLKFCEIFPGTTLKAATLEDIKKSKKIKMSLSIESVPEEK